MQNDVLNHEQRISAMEVIVKGDGKTAGIGPLVLSHDQDLNDKDNGLKARIRKLEDNSIKTAAYVFGAVLGAQGVFWVVANFVLKKGP